jgi:hypothetical protein
LHIGAIVVASDVKKPSVLGLGLVDVAFG